MVSESELPSLVAMKVSSISPTWVRSGLKLNLPVTALKLALDGKGRGVTEKVTVPPPGLVAVTVKLRLLPTLTLLSPIGSSWGPRETVKLNSAELELPARSQPYRDDNRVPVPRIASNFVDV